MRQKRCFGDEGFSSSFVLAVIFYISSFAVASAFTVSAVRFRIASIERHYDSDGQAYTLFAQFLEDMQIMVECQGDSLYSPEYLSLINGYQDFSVNLQDVSTGINLSTMKRIMDANPKMESLLELFDLEKEYGWINTAIADKEYLLSVVNDFGVSEPEELFPLVNHMPVCNVHFMQEEFIETVLEAYKISGASSKAQRLYKTASTSIVDGKKIKDILGVEDTAPVLDFIGCRSSFWNVHLETEDRNIDAIIAAVPFREEETRDVEKYIAIRRKVSPRRISHG